MVRADKVQRPGKLVLAFPSWAKAVPEIAVFGDKTEFVQMSFLDFE